MLHGRRNIPFFGNLAEKACCVDDKTVLFRYTYAPIHELFFSNLPQIRITTYVIRPYHLKKGQHPYWIRTIRTRWHVCVSFISNVNSFRTESRIERLGLHTVAYGKALTAVFAQIVLFRPPDGSTA